MHSGALFNAACLVADGRILGLTCKQNLAGEGIHYAIWSGDIASDVLLRSVPSSDAAALAGLTGIPAVVWGVLWVLASVWVIVAVLHRHLEADRAAVQVFSGRNS